MHQLLSHTIAQTLTAFAAAATISFGSVCGALDAAAATSYDNAAAAAAVSDEDNVSDGVDALPEQSTADAAAATVPEENTGEDTSTGETANAGGRSGEEAALQETQQENSRDEDEAPATSGTAWVDSTILGSIHYDTPVSLKDDYYSAVNQQWLTNTPMPSGSTEVSAASAMTETVRERKISLLNDRTLTDHDALITQTLYDLLLDWDTRNALGIEPVRPFVAAIQSIDSLDDLTTYLCDDAQNLLGNGFTQISMSQYINNPEYYAVEVAPTSLLLPDAADYAKISSSGKAALSLAQSKTYYMLGRLGFSQEEMEDTFNQCLAFETDLAACMDSNEVMAQSDYYNVTANRPCTLDDLAAMAGDYPLTRILRARRLDTSYVYNLPEPAWLQAMGQLYNEDNLENMKAYLLVHTVIPAMELTDRAAFDAMVDLAGSAASNDPEYIAYQYVETLLPEPLDNMYVRAYSSEEEKASVTGLVGEIISAYRTMLEGETWLSEETRSEALNKLDHIRVRVAYPDVLPDYSGLALTDRAHGGDLVHAFQTIRTFQRIQDAACVNQKLDDSHWAMTASTVNCFYNQLDNSINILAGMLDAPFYEEGMSREELMAGIGFVIGHEISHAFDSDGALYDENGTLRDWWTAADKAAYQAKREKLIAYYNGIVPAEGFGHVRGAQVADEAIADMGGMKCLLAIAAEDPDFDYDAFFRYFAGCWRGLRRGFAELMYMYQDEHPLYYLRVNVTLQQFDEFFRTYGIGEGDGMWLSEEDRISIW